MGHVGVIRIPVRLGRAVLTVAGIAAVATDPRARNHGIASVLLKEALEASKRAGLSFSLLFGIPDFYHRFGFVPAWPKHTATANVEELPSTSRWRARKARVADLAKMRQMYKKVYGPIDGTVPRDPRMFFFRKHDQRTILQGPARGDWAYVFSRMIKIDGTEQLHVSEAAGTGGDWPAAVMAWAARHAIKIGKQEVIFRLPAEHPICTNITFCNATVRTEHYRNRSAMVAVLDFAQLARQMGRGVVVAYRYGWRDRS